MANFWDLPKPVRDAIYRLHLVQDDQVDEAQYERSTAIDPEARLQFLAKRMPAICLISRQAEREAALIYYGENHFVFGRLKDGRRGSSVWRFNHMTRTRHVRLVRKVTYQWPQPYNGHGPGLGMAGECFTEIARFSNLQELYIRVDEEAMVRAMLVSRRFVQLSPPRPMTPQDGLAIMRYPGMSGLLKISDVPHVEFLKWYDHGGRETGGPMSGGMLETKILPKLKRPRPTMMAHSTHSSFDFLALPSELRNLVYRLLLHFDGPIHPSTEAPSAVVKGRSNKAQPGSALNILAVNRQVHDEAYGIFYDANMLEFYYPIQVQAFVHSISRERLRQVRRITLHYHNLTSGGVSLADIGLQSLRQLSGLRQLHVLFLFSTLSKHLIERPGLEVSRANPLRTSGLKRLFDLRGIDEILLREVDFDEKLEAIKKNRRFPDGFNPGSRELALIKFAEILNHVNAALAAAQLGRHNMTLLEDEAWHMRDPFPPAAVDTKKTPEPDEMGEAGVDASAEDAAAEVDTPAPVEENIRDRLRSAKRKTAAQEKNHTSGGVSEAGDAEADVIVSQVFSKHDSPREPTSSDDGPDSMPASAKEEREASENAADEDDMDDEIVVKHVLRPDRAGQVGGSDRAGDTACVHVEEEDEDEEASYADRDRSMEL